MRKNTLLIFSNILIISSLCIFGYIFFPVLQAYITPPSLSAESRTKEYSVWVPVINAGGVVKRNVNPWDEQEYKEVLKNRIAHAKGSALPNEDGTQFLFAHSSGSLLEQTRYNTVFLRLHELEKGDVIEIFYEGNKYVYQVREKKIVMPDDVSVLTESKKTQLILQTCTPLGTDWKRLLVFADPITE